MFRNLRVLPLPRVQWRRASTFVKYLPLHRGGDEIATLNALDHENIVSPIESKIEKNCCRLIFPRAQMDLYDFVKREKYISEQLVFKIVKDVSGGIAHLHSRGYCHNDIKLENILMFKGDHDAWSAKLSDFGMAYKCNNPPQYFSGKTPGTLAYFSPERAYDLQPIDHQAADMWALGVVMHLMIYRCFPNGHSTALPILSTDFDSKDNPTVSNVVLSNLLVINPQKRWSAQKVFDFIPEWVFKKI